MKTLRIAICLVLFSITLALPVLAASIPTTLSYQGTLTDKSGTPISASRTVVFSLYTVDTGGTAFWTETQTLVVTGGRLGATLGITTPLDIGKFGGDTWLGIAVQGEPEMTPRQKMTSVPYAFNGVPRGVITMWSGSIATIPAGWVICDGQPKNLPGGGTITPPNLLDRFIVGAGNGYAVGATGGSASANLQHQHPMAHAHDLSNHTHNGFGDGGDLRAATGYSDGTSMHLSHIAVSAVNPNTGALPGLPSVTAVTGAWGLADNFWSFTPVYGYTSGPNNNATGGSNAANTSNSGSTAQDIRPPYYALAYIMKL